MGHPNSSIFRMQRGFSFTAFPVTNNCNGGAAPSYPGTPYIFYNMNENTGTTLTNSGSGGAGLNGTLTNSPTWGTGKLGSGVVTAAGTTQHIAIPYGSGVNPTTQNLTIAFGVNVPSGTETTSRAEFGVSVGLNQRFHVQPVSVSGVSTARLGLQGSTASASASNHLVAAGWNHYCVTVNASTDTVTLYRNGVAGTGGALKTATSYTLASNLKLGLYDINTAPGGTYDDFLIYQSVEDCAAIYAAFEALPVVGGTFAQIATRFQAVHTDGSFTPINFGSAINQTKDVNAYGATAVLIEVDCTVGDCDEASFRVEYAKNGSGSFLQVPDTEGVDHIWMYGDASENYLNNGNPNARLTGSCTVSTGATILTSDQVPIIDLPTSGCVVMRVILRVGGNVGDYFDLRLINQNGVVFTGGYQLARLNVVAPQASAGP
jgi:hypothetical protein